MYFYFFPPIFLFNFTPPVLLLPSIFQFIQQFVLCVSSIHMKLQKELVSEKKCPSLFYPRVEKVLKLIAGL